MISYYRRIIIGKISNLESFKTKLAENKAINNVLKLGGAEYIKTMQLLYSELNKDIARIDKERDELAESIKRLFNDRLKFIQYAWEDNNLTKKEKKQIYTDYMDTSKVLYQYLIQKEEIAIKRKNQKEKYKDVAFGAMLVSVCVAAASLSVQLVKSVLNK